MNLKLMILLPFIFPMHVFANKQSEELLVSLNKISEILYQHDSLLWKIKFEPNLIFIDADNNRMIFVSLERGMASINDTIIWNKTIGLANSIVEYKGEKYVTINYQKYTELPLDEKAKLIIHETFHLYQNTLGVEMTTSYNQHLDTSVGRSLLRLEFAALKNALLESTDALCDAICIREYRQSLYPQNNEMAFELNEGLAEYTGIKMTINKVNDYLLHTLTYNPDKGYTNSFAYITGPIYAFLLDSLSPTWKKEFDGTEGLTSLISKSLRNRKQIESIIQIKEKYHYGYIELEEVTYFEDTEKYKKLLIEEEEKLLIKNNGIHIIFNPNDRVIPIDAHSVLLKNIELKSDWGILYAKDGLIRMNDWSSFLVYPPTKIYKDKVVGENYTLFLSELWYMCKENNIWTIKKSNHEYTK